MKWYWVTDMLDHRPQQLIIVIISCCTLVYRCTLVKITARNGALHCRKQFCYFEVISCQLQIKVKTQLSYLSWKVIWLQIFNKFFSSIKFEIISHITIIILYYIIQYIYPNNGKVSFKFKNVENSIHVVLHEILLL